MWPFFLLVVAGCVACQELPVGYSAKSTAAGVGMCAPTQEIRERESNKISAQSSIAVYYQSSWDMEHVTVVVLDERELLSQYV